MSGEALWRNRRKAYIIVLCIVIALVILVLAPLTTRKETPERKPPEVTSEPETDGKGDYLGLLARIPRDATGTPDRDTILERYRGLSQALYPDKPIAPPQIREPEADSIWGYTPEMRLDGEDVEMSVEMTTGRIWQVGDVPRSLREVSATGIIGEPMKLQGDDLASMEVEIKETLRRQLGLFIPPGATFGCTKRVYKDREVVRGAWYLSYYGYPHNNDSFHFTVVREQDGLHVADVVSGGLKALPPKPRIVIGEDAALREGSRAALSYWSRLYGQARQVGDAVIQEIVYTYPSTYVENPDDIAKLCSNPMKTKSYLAYAVCVKGIATLKDGREIRQELVVYVSCRDGKPLGACETVNEAWYKEE